MNSYLDAKEKAIFSALCINGPTSVSDLSKITLIHRTTVYPLLEKLQQKGLVQMVKIEGKMLVRAISKHELQEWVKRKKEVAENQANVFLEWANHQHNHEDSLIVETRHYEGFEAVKTLYGDTWRNNKEKCIYAITDYEKAYAVMGNFFREDYFKERIKHSIQVKSLLPNSSSGERDKKIAKGLLREMQFIDLFQDLGIELNLYDDKIALVAFDSKKPTGVLIKNAVMARALKNIFNFLWKNTKKPFDKNLKLRI